MLADRQGLFRTQPAISAQVRQLEQELNTTLFERLGTRISLTMAGMSADIVNFVT